MCTKILYVVFCSIVFAADSKSAGLESGSLEPESPAPSLRFNRLYRYEEIVDILKGFEKSYPGWVRLESIGKSSRGRDMWLFMLCNPETGKAAIKPAIYIDANIHATEVQGAEVSLYAIDFLLKNYGKLERVTSVLDRAAFYFVPVVNPDGRSRWFDGAASPHFPRTVVAPVDDDRDGLVDEDGYDDLTGDGFITGMRKKVAPGEGTHVLDPNDSRVLVRAEPGQKGDYVLLGREGVDNDGDGRINEDPYGYVDPNRSWGYCWRPKSSQAGAPDYPLQIPETRCIALWALEHQNIAAALTYHNCGKMILRGPGTKKQPPFPRKDVKVYDYLGSEGEKLLPGYRYMVLYKDLYPVSGDTMDHFYGIHGVLAFTVELYSAPLDLDSDGKVTPEERMKFNDLVTLGRQFVNWKEVDHPQYGKVEVGGYRKDVLRVPERWELEEECHRNTAFILFVARQLPKLTFGEPEVTKKGERLWRVEVPVFNERAIPTMTEMARKNTLHRPDVATVEGARVVSSGIVKDRWLDDVKLQRHRPERLLVEGIGGFSAVRLFFLLEGRGRITIKYASLKGGVHTLETVLE